VPVSTSDTADDRPGLTACSLCAGETLEGRDDRLGGQAARVAALSDVARVTTVECLDECERGDVLVVRPGPGGRRAGGRPVWFERLAGDEDTAALRGWLAAGGPGRAPMPGALAPRVLHRSAAAEATADA
jgi:(2Fe-2S) ferredoxin